MGDRQKKGQRDANAVLKLKATRKLIRIRTNFSQQNANKFNTPKVYRFRGRDKITPKKESKTKVTSPKSGLNALRIRGGKFLGTPAVPAHDAKDADCHESEKLTGQPDTSSEPSLMQACLNMQRMATSLTRAVSLPGVASQFQISLRPSSPVYSKSTSVQPVTAVVVRTNKAAKTPRSQPLPKVSSKRTPKKLQERRRHLNSQQRSRTKSTKSKKALSLQERRLHRSQQKKPPKSPKAKELSRHNSHQKNTPKSPKAKELSRHNSHQKNTSKSPKAKELSRHDSHQKNTSKSPKRKLKDSGAMNADLLLKVLRSGNRNHRASQVKRHANKRTSDNDDVLEEVVMIAGSPRPKFQRWRSSQKSWIYAEGGDIYASTAVAAAEGRYKLDCSTRVWDDNSGDTRRQDLDFMDMSGYDLGSAMHTYLDDRERGLNSKSAETPYKDICTLNIQPNQTAEQTNNAETVDKLSDVRIWYEPADSSSPEQINNAEVLYKSADETVTHENESEDEIRDPERISQKNDETMYISDSQQNDETAYISDSQKNDETAYISDSQKNDETAYIRPGAWVRSKAIVGGRAMKWRIQHSLRIQTSRTKTKRPFIGKPGRSNARVIERYARKLLVDRTVPTSMHQTVISGPVTLPNY